MNAERETITVSLESVEVYAEPQFVLEFDGKIYVTIGVVEFDPNDDDMDDDERADLADMRALLDAQRPVSGTIMGAPREAAAMAQSESKDED